ncbi:hypothetical protein [Streptomyces sp. YIM S03343]
MTLTAAQELRAAAQTLRNVEPFITGQLQRLALPVAEWLEREARDEEYRLAEFGHRTASPEAMKLARVLNGSEK